MVKIDKYASLKISLVSFLAMCAVVSWHIGDDGGVLMRWLAPVITVWSVPWFFFVSGVFFVYSIQKVSLGRFVLGKVRSLLIPYLIWCVLGVVILTLMGAKPPLDIRAVFALDRLHPVGDNPMWYIRVLMIIFTLAIPMWVVSIRALRTGVLQRVVFAVSLATTFIIFQKFSGVNLHLGPGSSLYYFLLGVILCDRVVRFPMLPIFDGQKRFFFGLTVLLVAMFIRGVWFALGYDFYKMGGTLVANASVLFFILSLLVLMDSERAIEHGWKMLGHFTKYTPFVYMSHWIFLGSLIGIARKLGMMPDVVYVSFSLVMPFVFVAVGAVIRRYVPDVYHVLTGNRG